MEVEFQMEQRTGMEKSQGCQAVEDQECRKEGEETMTSESSLSQSKAT